MLKLLAFLFIPIFFLGCIAIVEHQGTQRRIKSFGIPRKDVLDTLNQTDQKRKEKKEEFILFERREAE